MTKINNKNDLISKSLKTLSGINKNNSLMNDFSYQSIFSTAKIIKGKIYSESSFAKVCWKEVSKFHKTILVWKIVNNPSITIRGLKPKKYISKQKNNLKKIILRKF